MTGPLALAGDTAHIVRVAVARIDVGKGTAPVLAGLRLMDTTSNQTQYDTKKELA